MSQRKYQLTLQSDPNCQENIVAKYNKSQERRSGTNQVRIRIIREMSRENNYLTGRLSNRKIKSMNTGNISSIRMMKSFYMMSIKIAKDKGVCS